jgi:hypothetical protein
MAETKAKTQFQKYAGIYYTDKVTFSTGQGTLNCGRLTFTSAVALIGTRINQVTAKHLRPEIVLVRAKV